MITSETSGVWELDDVYHKDNAGYWNYTPDVPIYELWSWGYNGYGSLAQNDIVQRSSPVQIPGTEWDPNSIRSTTDQYILVPKTDGTLWSCGRNNGGQLGLNDIIERSSPTQIPGTQWNLIQSMRQTAMSTKTDGTLWVWGSGNNGLGLNDTISRSSPIQIPGTEWSDICKGGGNCRSFFARKSDGTLWSWGYNTIGNLGLNDQDKYPEHSGI
jgi:alpha-tubulin suppressor-like RCC1 family protein